MITNETHNPFVNFYIHFTAHLDAISQYQFNFKVINVNNVLLIYNYD